MIIFGIYGALFLLPAVKTRFLTRLIKFAWPATFHFVYTKVLKTIYFTFIAIALTIIFATADECLPCG